MAEAAGCKPHPAGVGERIVADAEVLRESLALRPRDPETGL
jgi:hypothetical protein